MAEFTKGKMRIEKYRKLDAIYLDDKCIIKMAFGEHAKELVRRWNSHDDLLIACRQAFNESHNPEVEKMLEAAIAQAEKS